MEYVLHIMVFAGIYIILAASLDLLAGHTGLLSIAHAAFYGLGAYTSALLTVKAGAPFLLGVLGGMFVAALLSLLVSLPSLRLLDDYFVIATFAFQVILFSIFNNWNELTGGPTGIPGIPQPAIFGLAITSHGGFLAAVGLCAAVAYGVVWQLSSGPFGRVLHAIREDEVFAKSLGKNTVLVKIVAFAVSSALAALAGSLYAHYISYIDPTSFTVMESILIISMVIIGGAGSLWGPLIGALVLVSLPELLRFVGLPNSVAANLRQIIYGGLLVVMMMIRPQGLAGKYAFGK
ncbi:MAG: branched-chain amino acid ABC transporter permease [Phycisphaerae bacterium]|nr:branched-chain amino acid ABC transporter permease [Phycisphaerae bacterium]